MPSTGDLRRAGGSAALALSLWAAAPAAAQHRQLTLVRVVLDCAVLPDRRVEDCRVLDEIPQGQGYARLVLRWFADPGYRVPEAHAKRAIGGRVKFDIPLTAISGPAVKR